MKAETVVRHQALITRKLSTMRLAGLLACSILDNLPIPQTGTVVLEISRTHMELTAAVSAQDFHLIPFSLIAPRIEG